MLRAILNKSRWKHPTRHQLYGHLPPIMKTIQVRRTRYAGHCWRSKDELISDILLWTPTYDQAKAGRPARTYIQQLCEDTGCSPEDLPEAMNDREKWLWYIDLQPGQTCHSKDGGSAYSIGVGELGWQCETGLKSHGTLTDWCTGREWPVNCMSVISTWWQSNMPFQGRQKWHIPMASHGEILSGRWTII